MAPRPDRVLNYATDVPVTRTIEEIKAILRAHSARSVTEEYGPGGQVVGISFAHATEWGVRAYTLPVKTGRVLAQLVAERNKGRAPQHPSYIKTIEAAPQTMKDQAERAAWRTVKTWLEVLFALVSSQQVPFEQAMLSYEMVDDTRTAFDLYRAGQMKALEGAH